MTYKEYLNTPYWKKKRKEILDLRGNRCDICLSTKYLNIHHRYYKNRRGSILFREDNQALSILCSHCHKLYHTYFGVRKMHKKYFKMIRRLRHIGYEDKQAFYLVALDTPNANRIWYRERGVHTKCSVPLPNCRLSMEIGFKLVM